jgi:hypothetical protein
MPQRPPRWWRSTFVGFGKTGQNPLRIVGDSARDRGAMTRFPRWAPCRRDSGASGQSSALRGHFTMVREASFTAQSAAESRRLNIVEVHREPVE